MLTQLQWDCGEKQQSETHIQFVFVLHYEDVERIPYDWPSIQPSVGGREVSGKAPLSMHTAAPTCICVWTCVSSHKDGGGVENKGKDFAAG